MKGHDSGGKTVCIEHVISVGLCGNKNEMLEYAKKGPTELMHIYGIATEYAVIRARAEGRDTTYIKGKFQADNLVNNEHYVSGQLILPDSLSSYIVASLMEQCPLLLDCNIGIQTADKSQLGYKFVCILNEKEESSGKEKSE